MLASSNATTPGRAASPACGQYCRSGRPAASLCDGHYRTGLADPLLLGLLEAVQRAPAGRWRRGL